MKALIPSHREKKRYLLFEDKTTRKDVEKSIKEFVGNLGLAKASLRWIKKGVLMINREALNEVRASFAVSKKPIKVLKVSGTLKGLGVK